MCTDDDVYDGYYIPKGSVVIGNSWYRTFFFLISRQDIYTLTSLLGPFYIMWRSFQNRRNTNQSVI